jgi:lysophospholipase L1-like esterase
MTRIAVVGDSISAGSPLWDPDPAVRARIEAPDERSQWQWWAAQANPSLEFHTSAVYGERTDQIALRLDLVLGGADVLVVQGGINDIAQGRPIEKAARNIEAMVERGREAGIVVAVADVLFWPDGPSRGIQDDVIRPLNKLIRAIDGVTHLPFHDTLGVGFDWSDDGDHPSVEGYRLLGECAAPLL